MAYTKENFKTKKAFKEAFVREGKLPAYSPGPFGLRDGSEVIEGPHFPEPHRWYASVEIRDGYVVKIYG